MEDHQKSNLAVGLHIYIGTTGTGKTHKAIRDCLKTAVQNNQGLLVIDTGGANNLASIPEYTAEQAIDLVSRGRIARVVPRDDIVFDTLIQAVDTTGNLVLFIDEVSSWASNRNLQRIIRVWRHRCLSVYLTSQMVGRDLEQAVQACNPHFYVFRTTAPRTLEFWQKWLNIPIDKIRALGVGEYIEATF